MPTQMIDREKTPLSEQVAPQRSVASPALPARLTPIEVWRAIEKASFAVLSYVTPAGEPRSSGVVYGVAKGRIYVIVGGTSWKARQLVSGQRVSVTVPVRRGGILSLLVPIPPATISFVARVRMHPEGSLDPVAVAPRLKNLLPEAGRATACVLELTPERSFLTFGIGVSLRAMRDPLRAIARVPVS